MTVTQIRKAFKEDASTTPYFFRNNHDPKYNLIIDTGRQLLLSCEPIFSNKKIPSDLLDSIYNNIWNRLDLLLEVNHNYFNLYYEYLLEMLEFYMNISEKAELYEICANIREIQEQFNKTNVE
jgi:hypothetical protein